MLVFMKLFDLRRWSIKLLTWTASLWPDEIFLKMQYKLRMQCKLDLNTPRTFNEKLQWLKLYNRNVKYTQMVDKEAVKSYVASCIGAEYIIPTLAVYNRVNEIDISCLPKSFVLKTTHGGGGYGVIICRNKSNFNQQEAIKRLKKSLKQNLYLNYREWPYKNVVPRIIVEKYMTDFGENLATNHRTEELKDYKFFCFNGKVRCLKVDFNRFIDHRANYYSRNWELLPFDEQGCPRDENILMNRPVQLEKMIKLAEQLSKGIPFLRVDFYLSGGCIYFGELTFFPASGMSRFYPKKWEYTFGEWINLPEKPSIP